MAAVEFAARAFFLPVESIWTRLVAGTPDPPKRSSESDFDSGESSDADGGLRRRLWSRYRHPRDRDRQCRVIFGVDGGKLRLKAAR